MLLPFFGYIHPSKNSSITRIPFSLQISINSSAEVKVGDAVVDTYDTEYGFRYIAFDTETGFYLNGENGLCVIA